MRGAPEFSLTQLSAIEMAACDGFARTLGSVRRKL